jgi:PAS domain S-box-containing protein
MISYIAYAQIDIMQLMAPDGAIIDQDKYSELFLRITRTAGLLIPFVAVGYGLASMYSLVQRSPTFNATGFLVVAILFIMLGIVQNIHKPDKPVSLGVYIGLYHLMGIVYLIVGPGFTGPIAICWIVLAFITEIFFGRIGAIISVSVIFLSAFITFMAEPVKYPRAVDYIVYLMIIVVSLVIMILLRRVQLVEHEDLKQSKLQEELHREELKTLINSVGIAIASTSKTGAIRLYNSALLDLLDTHDTLTGKQIDQVFHLVDKDRNPVPLQNILSGSNSVINNDDFMHQFENGETMNLSISSAPIHDTDGYIFIVRDITKAKSLEEERNEFIAVMSHELRTPVAIVEANISMLQYQIEKKQDPQTFKTHLEDAEKQIRYLAGLIKDLSTLSRAERNIGFAPESVNINELLGALHRGYQSKAKAKGLDFMLQLPPEIENVTTSKLYLEEILHNFITNAIKYTEHGSVSINAHSLGDAIAITISDTGIGISKSDQKQIFNKFYRSEHYLTMQHSGTGLGLYVVRKLAHKIGAKIIVESEINRGSTFTLMLPKTLQPEPESGIESNIVIS